MGCGRESEDSFAVVDTWCSLVVRVFSMLS